MYDADLVFGVKSGQGLELRDWGLVFRGYCLRLTVCKNENTGSTDHHQTYRSD